jgi:hypothetical protein
MHNYLLTLIDGGGPICTIQRLKPICDTLLSTFAFKFNLRRYNLDRKVEAARTALEQQKAGEGVSSTSQTGGCSY